MGQAFAPGIWREAQRLASRYQILLQPEPEVGYLGRVVEMPLVMADGPTVEACAASTLAALTAAIATMHEQGEQPPAPA